MRFLRSYLKFLNFQKWHKFSSKIKNISESDAKMAKFWIFGKKHGLSHFCKNLPLGGCCLYLWAMLHPWSLVHSKASLLHLKALVDEKNIKSTAKQTFMLQRTRKDCIKIWSYMKKMVLKGSHVHLFEARNHKNSGRWVRNEKGCLFYSW